MGTTKQAASKLVDAMVVAGFLERRDHPTDARAKLLRLTPRGRRLATVVEEIYAELEQQWARTLGTAGMARLRNDLTRVLLASHDGLLPPVRPAP